MIVEGDLIRIIQGPRENLHRPAIDPLFRSAAESFGRRVIGVILTGSLDDGTSGLMVVAAHGGRTVVQDPRTALFASMPESALEQVPQSEVASIADMAACLTAIVAEPLPDQPQTMRPDPLTPEEIKLSELDMSELEKDERPGRPSVFACPDCGGVLWELEDHGFLRFRCRVGHAYTARHLGAEQRQSVESSLWAALRALEERAALYRRMAERADASRHPRSAERFRENEADNRQNARILRDFLLRVNRADEDRFADEEAS
jgi:two-component system chemotaxis response regulator CheB